MIIVVGKKVNNRFKKATVIDVKINNNKPIVISKEEVRKIFDLNLVVSDMKFFK